MSGRSPIRIRPWIERLWRTDLNWYETALWAPLAAPAAIYRGAMALRLAYWRAMRRRADVLTISVGNLTVGGNSKTPFTLFLANRLSARGLRVGIVSRGFGGQLGNRTAALVSDGMRRMLTPQEAGDEAAMMAQSFGGPVAVARRRIHGIELLQGLGPLDAVILDDAFQHVRLARDLDLVLVNAERGLGNGWMLPAGPMREPARSAKRADAVILVATGNGQAEAFGGVMRHALKRRKVLHANIRPRALVRSERGRWRELPLTLAGKRVVAVSGLADATAFHTMIRELGADLAGVLEYPDHYCYTAADWQTVAQAARNAEIVLTTEKDLVKLEGFPSAADSVYALRLEVSMDEDEARLLETAVGSRRRLRLAAQG